MRDLAVGDPDRIFDELGEGAEPAAGDDRQGGNEG